MPLLQYLGVLAPAKNAIRKLFPFSFGRPSSAAPAVPAAPAGSQTAVTTTPPPTDSEANANGNATAQAPAKEKGKQKAKGKASASETPASTPKTTTTMPAMTVAAGNHYSTVHEDKENRPPEGHGSEDVTPALKKLSLGEQDALAEAKALIPEEVVEEDPAVLAERAHHMRFIGEALDMVRFSATNVDEEKKQK